MALSDTEVVGLRNYLLAGGMLIVDDFWGSREWANFEHELTRVLPEYPIVELPVDHPVLHTFYQIDTVLQVPNVRNGKLGGPTWEGVPFSGCETYTSGTKDGSENSNRSRKMCCVGKWKKNVVYGRWQVAGRVM